MSKPCDHGPSERTAYSGKRIQYLDGRKCCSEQSLSEVIVEEIVLGNAWLII